MANHEVSRSLSCEDAGTIDRIQRLEKELARQSSPTRAQRQLDREQEAEKEGAGGTAAAEEEVGTPIARKEKGGVRTMWRMFGCGSSRKKE